MAGDTVSPLVEIRGLRQAFGPVIALGGIDARIEPGLITGLVGPDAAGKTTLLRLVAGLLRPTSGSIHVFGYDMAANAAAAHPSIGYMPQRFGLYEDLTVEENIRFYADLFEVPRELWEARAHSMLVASDMTQFRKRLAGQLSGGMKQKLGLTCSLVHTPRVLLLDEPTTGVDPLSRREFWQILYSLRAEGVAMLISTAYLDEAERCDRLALLHRGTMMHCDTPAKLKSRMPGAMLEVASAEPRKVREVVLPLPGVTGVLLVGNGAHVHVDDAERRTPQLAQALAAAGVQATRIAEVAPTIEDLFVALLDQNSEA
jgi:ABC-2 type transport system ATP-binding protein